MSIEYQLVEQRTENPCVPGSIPGDTTKKEAGSKVQKGPLSSSFRTISVLDKYRTFGLQFLGQQTIHNPMFVTFHILIVYSGKGVKIFANSVIWHRNNMEFGSNLFSKMAHSFSFIAIMVPYEGVLSFHTLTVHRRCSVRRERGE